MPKVKNHNLQARLDEIKARDRIEYAKLLHQVQLIKNRQTTGASPDQNQNAAA